MDIFQGVETEQIGADLSKVVDRIVRQYESFGVAFQKEFIQNAWDAREDRNTAKNWNATINTYRDHAKTHIILEDKGTIGMNDKRWNAFTSLWKPEKSHEDAGGQGQGKFVLMGASKERRLIVESRSRELGYRLQILQNDNKSKLNSNLLLDQYIPSAKPLDHIGTRIWVYDATESALNLLKSRDFTDSITESWWQVLDRSRFDANIMVLSRPIILPKLPEIIEERVIYKDHKLGDLGYIKKFDLNFHSEKLPPSFSGVRVQRSNMTVLRIPFEVNDREYDGKFSGHIEFDNDLEVRLKKIERTDHCGFVFDSPWKEIKKIIRDEAQKFVNEIVPAKTQKRNLNVDTSKLIKKANQIINDYCPEVIGGGSLMPYLPPKEKLPLRIKYLNIGKKEVKYKEIVSPTCKIVNDTGDYKKLTLSVDLKYQGRKIIEWEYKINIKPEKEKLINLATINLLPNDFQQGQYTIRIILQEDNHDIDSKSSSFYLEETRETTRRGFIKTLDFYESPEPLRNLPISNGVIGLNLGHEEFVNIYSSFDKNPRSQTKQIGFYIIRICIDEAISELSKAKFKESADEDVDDIMRDIILTRDRMYADVYA